MKNIILIGFMGCGKTAIGTLLAENLGMNFIDADSFLVEKEGMTISEIFDRFGEEYFRTLESKVMKEISCMDNIVLATGGGAVKSQTNMMLFEKDIIIYLKCSEDKIYKNTLNSVDRPLLNVDNRRQVIEKLFKERVSLYEKYATLIFENDYDTPELAVENLLRRIEDEENKSY